MRIRCLFGPPIFADEEQTRRAWVLHVILWSLLLIGIVPFVAFVLLLPQNQARWIAVQLVVTFTIPVLMLLNRRGHTRMASFSLLVVLWLLGTWLALTGGGVHSPISLGFVVDVLVAGMLFGEKAGVVAAIVFSLTGLVCAGLEAMGHLPASRVTHTALSLWLTQTLYLGLIAGFQFLANRSIKDALERARRELDQRRQTETALRDSRDELEARVRERTAELQTVNKELEAFTYSVSHDLRSPLRTVSGFSDLLMLKYGGDMPADARQFLTAIKTSAERMGHLIQDLLNLSHIDRQPLSSQPVNLTSLVRETLEELRGQQQGRSINVRVEELPDCIGDPSLLRQVFINLLSNAIKFTGNQAKALIEIGRNRKEAEPVYFVRDNGVGFDMKYADKLFGVFQRLHSVEQFAGTGIGLSIVQRIIHRHGGRIWAESAVNQGTTFYFSLLACSNK